MSHTAVARVGRFAGFGFQGREANPLWQRAAAAGLVAAWLAVAGAQGSTAAEPVAGPAAAADPHARFPFFPSAQTTPDGKPIALSAYAQNAQCITCHEQIGKQWQGSMHSAAMTDPVFQALYRVGHAETKGLTDKLCAGCHSSPFVVSGHSAPDDWQPLGPPVTEGVSCVVCHSISDSNLTAPDALPANGSFVTDPAGPIQGRHEGRRCTLPGGRGTRQNLMLGKSEFCANCHGVVHPLNGLVIEKTFEEWRGSVYAAKGIQCQDCHMQPVELAVQTARTLKKVLNPGRVTKTAPERDHVASHYFVGGNSAVTGLLGAADHARMAEQLLESAASLELQLPERAAPGTLVQLRVKVNNETAGHNLPTSLIEVRQMWLDVRVEDAEGRELYRSGALDAEGNLDPDAIVFHAIAVDAAGQPTVKPWEMTRFTYVHTVPPKGYTLERYAFVVPESAKGPVKVSARLRYRAAPQALLRQLLNNPELTLPVVDMTAAERMVNLGG